MVEVLEGPFPLVLLAAAQQDEGVVDVERGQGFGEFDLVPALIVLPDHLVDLEGPDLQQDLQLWDREVVQAYEAEATGHSFGSHKPVQVKVVHAVLDVWDT